jgi:hypothetical protein
LRQAVECFKQATVFQLLPSTAMGLEGSKAVEHFVVSFAVVA